MLIHQPVWWIHAMLIQRRQAGSRGPSAVLRNTNSTMRDASDDWSWRNTGGSMSTAQERLKTICWADGHVRLIDQTRLPTELVYLDITAAKDMFHAIRTLQVRGAPAIGIAAAYGLYLAVSDFPDHRTTGDFLAYVDKNCRYLASARPTAVNLFWALEKLGKTAHAYSGSSVPEIKRHLLEEAHQIFATDRQTCRQIGENGYELVKDLSAILTHCNAGGLATSEYGTALAPVYIAAEKGHLLRVYADETRPLLQGARITAFELHKAGIPVTLLCDNMAAVVMSQKKVGAVIVGADRIARNGDTANKIGTYSLAINAKAHGVPFYVAAPISTFDPNCPSGDKIPIEEREAEEVTCGFGKRTAPEGIDVYNPAFDVTPHRLIDGIITEVGVVRPPFHEGIDRLFA